MKQRTKKNMLTFLLTCLVSIFCITYAKPTVTQAADGDRYTLNVQGEFHYEWSWEIAGLVNQLRQGLGKSSLNLDAYLTEVAMQRAAEIAVYYSHTRPNGTKCYTAFEGYGSARGENIAIGQTSAQAVYTAWYNSQGHYENMVKAGYRSIGIGCYYYQGLYCWVQVFSDKVGSAATKNGTEYLCKTVDFLEQGISPVLNGGSDLQLSVGHSETLSCTIHNSFRYGDIRNDSFIWSSSDTSVATVDSAGCVTGVGKGNCTISAVPRKISSGSPRLTKAVTVVMDLADAEITGTTDYTYTGSAILPNVTVVYGGKTLVQNKDYTLESSYNVNVGSKLCSIKGIGDYSGSNSFSFTINCKDITGGTLNLSQTSFTYTGGYQRPTVEGITLPDGTKVDTYYRVTGDSWANAGTYTCSAEGYGNYTGTCTAVWTILRCPVTAPTIHSVSYRYDGSFHYGFGAANGYYNGYSFTGTTIAVSPGTYQFRAVLDSNYCWSDGTTADKVYTWKINPRSTKIKSYVNTQNGIKITWEKNAEADGYLIYRSGKKIAAVNGNTNTYLDKGVKTASSGKQFSYTVQAYTKASREKAAAYSAKSSVVKAMRVRNTSSLRVTGQKGKVTLQWNAVSGCYFQICRSTSGKAGTFKLVKTVKGKKYVDRNLSKGTYYYKIRTYKVQNGKKICSPFTTVRKVKVK